MQQIYWSHGVTWFLCGFKKLFVYFIELLLHTEKGSSGVRWRRSECSIANSDRNQKNPLSQRVFEEIQPALSRRTDSDTWRCGCSDDTKTFHKKQLSVHISPPETACVRQDSFAFNFLGGWEELLGYLVLCYFGPISSFRRTS